MGSTNILDMNNRVDDLEKSYPANKVVMTGGGNVENSLTGRLLTYENVTVTPGTFLWIANINTGHSKVYCGYAKNANVIVYVAESPGEELIQLFARNLGTDSVTTTIYLKEIG